MRAALIPVALLVAACGTIETAPVDSGIYSLTYTEGGAFSPGMFFNEMDTAAREACPNGYEKQSESTTGVQGNRSFVWQVRCL